MEMSVLTQEQLREALHYDPDTGVFTWLKPQSNRCKAGAPAGTLDGKGYVVIGVYGKRHLAHRLAFLYMTGKWPAGEVDHVHGNRTDNRWAGLRVGDRAFNGQNLRGARSDSATGLQGVERLPSGKFRARIGINGVMKSIGTFDSASAAHEAFLAQKRTHHAGCVI